MSSIGARWSPRALGSSAFFPRASLSGNMQWVVVLRYPPTKGQKSLQGHFWGTKTSDSAQTYPTPWSVLNGEGKLLTPCGTCKRGWWRLKAPYRRWSWQPQCWADQTGLASIQDHNQEVSVLLGCFRSSSGCQLWKQRGNCKQKK